MADVPAGGNPLRKYFWAYILSAYPLLFAIVMWETESSRYSLSGSSLLAFISLGALGITSVLMAVFIYRKNLPVTRQLTAAGIVCVFVLFGAGISSQIDFLTLLFLVVLFFGPWLVTTAYWVRYFEAHAAAVPAAPAPAASQEPGLLEYRGDISENAYFKAYLVSGWPLLVALYLNFERYSPFTEFITVAFVISLGGFGLLSLVSAACVKWRKPRIILSLMGVNILLVIVFMVAFLVFTSGSDPETTVLQLLLMCTLFFGPYFVTTMYFRQKNQYLLPVSEEAMQRFNEAVLHTNQGRYQDAMEACDKAIALAPHFADAHNQRGVALSRLRDYAGALVSFEKAAALNPELVEAWYNSGVMLNELGRHSEALAAYDRALSLNPGYLNAITKRGFTLGELKRYDEAMQMLDAAVSRQPGDAVAWNNRGYVLKNLGKYADAVASYDHALDHNPYEPSSWNNRGIALKEMGRYEDAATSFKKATELAPDDPAIWRNRLAVLRSLDRHQEAADACAEILRIRPQDTAVRAEKEELMAILTQAKEKEMLAGRALEAESFGHLPDSVKTVLGKKDPPPSAREVSTALGEVDTFLATARPQIRLELRFNRLGMDMWEKKTIAVTNTGTAHAKDVTITCPGDVEVRRIRPLDLMAGESREIEIGIRAKVRGTIPLDITVTWSDRKGKSSRESFDFDIEILETGATPPSPVGAFTPRAVTPRQIPAELVDRYSEAEFIGKGGFARVFKAKKKTGQVVAVKIPISLDEQTGRSFIAELQNWTRLDHPNIVKVFHYNIMPTPYFEMDLCDGALAAEKKPIPPEEAAFILFSVCEGLKYAHARKIIHRDLKPQNILVKNGVPKISDWGLSRVISESTSTTVTSFTPYYAAPEQINHQAKDERTDIWQLGVILYELVTGRLPFNGDTMIEIGMGIVTKDPVPPGAIVSDAAVLDAVVMKCLQKDPKDRYPSVLELQKDLALLLRKNYTGLLQNSVSVQDFSRSAAYCGDLVMINLVTGDLKSACTYIEDLARYSRGEMKAESEELAEQIRMRMEMGLDEVPEELVHKAEALVHKVRYGSGT
ncbi:MAG: tetratricopeptide repeat protein [Methanomicrobiales archaeon]|nr:tetratricopeptide repeat protein [Methanomicrobiales archaeon]